MKEKLLRLDGVAVMEGNFMFLYGRTLKDLASKLGFNADHDSEGNPLYLGEMYRVDGEGIHRV